MYAGSNWIKRNVTKEMSPLGEAVADFLGDLFMGIYHLDYKALKRVDWANTRYIEFILGWRTLSTVDFDELTTIVVLAHDRALRVEVNPHAFRYLRLLFHQRERGDNSMEQCPTLEDHIIRIRQRYINE